MDCELAVALGSLSLEQKFRDNHQTKHREKSTAVHRPCEEQQTAQKKTYGHNLLRKDQINAFSRPCFYRTITAESPAPASDGSLLPRLHPHCALATVTIWEMKIWIINHACEDNRIPTPLISVTPDLLRALNLAGKKVADGCEAVEILMIDGWKLGAGNYCWANSLRGCCGLQQPDIYQTEILVWGTVPNEAIVARWRWTDLTGSGLFRVFPALNSIVADRKLADLRSDLKRNAENVEAAELTFILDQLGLDPSSIYLRQVFCFLIASARGHRVPQELRTIEGKLLQGRDADMKTHDHYAYNLAFSKIESERYPCFEDWREMRENAEIRGWELFDSYDHSAYGIKGWIREHEPTVQ